MRGLGQLYARWDGKGVPAIRGEAITPGVRFVMLAQDTVTFHRLTGWDAAAAVVRKRSGRQYDPVVANLFLRVGAELLASLDATRSYAEALAAEAGVPVHLTDDELDRACEAIADFTDIKTPWMLDHSRRVADLATRAAQRAGLSADEVRWLRRAGLVHDIGRVGISAGLWSKPGALAPDQ